MIELPPSRWTVEAYIEAWVDRGDYVTADELYAAMVKVGRVHAPALLCDANTEGLVLGDDLAEVVADAWSADEYPERLGRAAWRSMFDVTGYVLDNRRGRVPRPAEPLTLYRGAMAEYRGGWAWTDDLALARRFAEGGMLGRATGVVYVAEVEPWRLFCRCDGRNEGEYVVDTDGLRIEVAEQGSAAGSDTR